MNIKTQFLYLATTGLFLCDGSHIWLERQLQYKLKHTCTMGSWILNSKFSPLQFACFDLYYKWPFFPIFPTSQSRVFSRLYIPVKLLCILFNSISISEILKVKLFLIRSLEWNGIVTLTWLQSTDNYIFPPLFQKFKMGGYFTLQLTRFISEIVVKCNYWIGISFQQTRTLS